MTRYRPPVEAVDVDSGLYHLAVAALFAGIGATADETSLALAYLGRWSLPATPRQARDEATTALARVRALADRPAIPAQRRPLDPARDPRPF